MPYGLNDKRLPKHIKNLSLEKRKKWVETWNSVYADSNGDEGQAFRVANAAMREAKKAPEGQWITISGHKILLKPGQSPGDAFAARLAKVKGEQVQEAVDGAFCASLDSDWGKEVDAKEIVMRRLYLAPPHGKLIAEGKKTVLVLSNEQEFLGPPLLLTSGPWVYGFLCVKQGIRCLSTALKESFSTHRVTERERARWWKGRETLWLYSISAYLPFPSPQRWVVPAGIGLLGEVAFSLEHCILCEQEPYHDVLWAEGQGRAWFCDEHYRWWLGVEDTALDVVGYKVRQGTIPEKFSESEPGPEQPQERNRLAAQSKVLYMRVNYGLAWE